MNNADPEAVESEKDIGVVFRRDLSPSDHCAAVVAKATRVLATMKRSFTFMETDMFLPLYKTLVRPLLEYGAPAWSPCSRDDIDALEKVQHRATKLVPSLRHLSYPERLRRLRLPTLIYRRVRGDLITTYRLVQGLDDFDYRQLFTLSADAHNHPTRGIRKMYKPGLRRNWPLTACKNAFNHRVVNWWNRLPEDVVTAPSLNSFKEHLDRFAPSMMDVYSDVPARLDAALLHSVDRYMFLPEHIHNV
jgi:hypothetical protein